jgi:hypothetical protein
VEVATLTDPIISFIDTPLMGESHWKVIKKRLSTNNLDFAKLEDCAKAAMRIAADTSINGKQPCLVPSRFSYHVLQGRAFGIVPRQLAPEGYVDLDHDSPKKGTILDIFEAANEKQQQLAAAKNQI